MLLHLDRMIGLVLLTERAFAPKIASLYLFILNGQKFATISLSLEFLIFTKARFPVGP